MIISTYDNSLQIDNGQKLSNPISVKMVTVCDGSYTDFMITIPENAEISRGKTQLKHTGQPYKIRVYNQPVQPSGKTAADLKRTLSTCNSFNL
jgi:hypothetical protein